MIFYVALLLGGSSGCEKCCHRKVIHHAGPGARPLDSGKALRVLLYGLLFSTLHVLLRFLEHLPVHLLHRLRVLHRLESGGSCPDAQAHAPASEDG